MPNWPEVIQKVERITFKVITDSGHGTGFIVQAIDERFTIATAWHVIEELWKAKDKFARAVNLVAASGTIVIEAMAVGVARLGPEGSDTGILWVGKAMPSQAVDGILRALAASGIVGGLLDLSGGGGVIKISGHREPTLSNETSCFLPGEQVIKGMDVGWLGYPGVAHESPCFFSGKIAGFHQTPRLYLIDGTSIRGQSGGPVFDGHGRIFGIVSKYLGPDTATMGGLLGAVPIVDIDKMCAGYK